MVNCKRPPNPSFTIFCKVEMRTSLIIYYLLPKTISVVNPFNDVYAQQFP